jgi:hypothetical protein
MHIYKSRFLVRGEVWYDHEPDQTPVDWIFYRQRSRPAPGARWKYFYTVLLDLGESAEALLRQMSKSTAYKIRRARDKDGFTCECLDPVSRETLDSFEQTHNRFAAIKGISPLDRPFLDQLAKDGFLELSFARDPEGRPLVYHTYYRDADRSCLLHTVSLHQTVSDSTARNAMGRANRYLFWCDILRHQARGLKLFDFGGWYPGNTDQDRLDINQFKEGFGGKIVREYNCEQILSLKGWVALRAAGLLERAKLFMSRPKEPAMSIQPELVQRQISVPAD